MTAVSGGSLGIGSLTRLVLCNSFVDHCEERKAN
jgi:hypothetical protein